MAVPSSRPRVFTIAAATPFLPALAEAFLDGRLAPLDRSDPLALAAATVLLPTRRAVRAFRDELIARLGGDAAILPAIRPIGDIDEGDDLLDPLSEAGADRLVQPPALSRLARHLALTRLTLAWGTAVRRDLLALEPDEPLLIPASAADAAGLAGDLARLLDDIAVAAIGWEAIARLVPEDHARYFQVTLDFLKIVAEQWPAYLDEIGRADPTERRDRLIRDAADRLDARPPSAPIVAAGSTGSIPATAMLLKAIARSPTGAVVLPGLDQDLDDAGWDAIGDTATADASTFGHPQFGLKQLIADIGVARAEVIGLGTVPAPVARRARLISEALRPAETIDARQAVAAAAPEDAFGGVDLVVARNEQEEAVAIALAIREAVERPGATSALVTPDRGLARRVAAELGRWGLTVDDSAGAPLDREPAGIFARLAASVAASADPVDLLALLKHPFAAFGMDRALCRRGARVLEVAVLRGHRVAGGIAGLAPALAAARAEVTDPARPHVASARRRLQAGDWRLAGTLVGRLVDGLRALETALARPGAMEAAVLTGLLLEALAKAATDNSRAPPLLWQGAGGAALADLLSGLRDEGESGLAIRPDEYPFLLARMMGQVTVPRPVGADPRIHIWGTLEARLQSVDLLVLGALDEGVWPAATRTDPWLSRAMRAEIGLPPPERRLGLAAHDFVQAMSAPRVVVSRAAKRGGAPTVESRWLQRLRALLGEAAFGAMQARGDGTIALARDIDWVRPAEVRPVGRPEPKPPVAARPPGLSVTEIETLVRDPYAIYARRVLGLEELDPIGGAPDYAMRGSLIHEALGDFTRVWKGAWDGAATAALIDTGRRVLAAIEDFPDLHAIWSFRFANMARWLVAWEAHRSPEIATRHAEIGGHIEIPTSTGSFRLRGRADRIDVRTDGDLEILDFKTGSPPSATRLIVGFAPQLGLEAAMARRGGFDPSFAGRAIARLAWIGLGRVGRDEPVRSAVERDQTADTVAEIVFERFRRLIAAFDDPGRPYVSRARPMFEMRYESPYDHLARVREWGLVESEEDVEVAWRPPA